VSTGQRHPCGWQAQRVPDSTARDSTAREPTARESKGAKLGWTDPRESGPPRGPGGDRIDDAERTRTLLEGLDAQAQALAALDDAEAAEELARAEIARTTWADRVRAVAATGHATDSLIEVELPDGQVIAARVVAVLADGVQLADDLCTWIIRSGAVHSIVGVGLRTREATRIEQRLSVTSILREWAHERRPVQCMSVRGLREGTVVRVGADHIDLAEHERGEPTSIRRIRTLPLPSLWAVRCWS